MDNQENGTGFVTYKINDAIEIRINPTDAKFAKKILKTFEALDKKRGEFLVELRCAPVTDIYDVCAKLDAEMRKIIDNCLDAPVCAALFGDDFITMPSVSGPPLWCNLLIGVMNVIDKDVLNKQKKANPKIKNLISNYQTVRKGR